MDPNANLPRTRTATVTWEDDRAVVLNGDALTLLRTFADQSIHAVVTDPPYAVGKSQSSGDDSDVMAVPMLGMQSQNWHEKATHSRGYADNDPRKFQKWCAAWLTECFRVLTPGGHLIAFGGTRTWHRLAVAVEDSGFEIRDSLAWLYSSGFPKSRDVSRDLVNAGDIDGARTWAGWGTALKPAHEPMVLARKPLGATVAKTVITHGTGALNIAATRLPSPTAHREGKWPSNVFLDAARAQQLSQSSPEPAGASFWVSKPNQHERVRIDGVEHPTVKPLALMRQLVRLVTPPGGTVLDPFAGSGSTVEACLLEGFRAVAIERERAYVQLITERLRRNLSPFAATAGVDDAAPTLPI